MISRTPSDDVHDPITRLISLENTHNRCGGVVLSAEYIRQVGLLARRHGLSLHMDGARLFNAVAALGLPAAELAAPADSVTICLSKGLCAPVGSVLCGSKEYIRRAHRIRKMLGGGMRQAGVLAAAGLIALEKMADRLVEDHARAAKLAEGLSRVPGLALDSGMPATNMVFLHLEDSVPYSADEVAARMLKRRIKIGAVSARGFRLVTHYWIDDAALEKTILSFREIL
jgi:threonine aldolase